MKKRIILMLICSLLLLTFTAFSAKENELLVYHWWTAGGEKVAIDALFEAFLEKYPEYDIVENPVGGGGGGIMRSQIKTMVMAGNPPDTFQITYGTGMIESFTSILQPIDHLMKDFNVPQDVMDWGRVDGKMYGVPLNIMQSNCLWYNKEIIEELDIQMPINSIKEFYAACEKIKNAGYTPLAVGAGMGQGFWLGTLYEAIVSALPNGADVLNAYYAGEVVPSENETLVEALKSMAYIYNNGYINSDFSALTWDQAGQMLANGKAAFFVMGDWTKGLFDASGLKANVDYGYQSFPGSSVFVGHADCFVLPIGVDSQVAKDWLSYLTTAEAETVFCPLKGATPPRLDAPVEGIYDSIALEIMGKFRDPEITKILSEFGAPPEAYLSLFGTFFSEFFLNPKVNAATLENFDITYEEVFLY
ncbi:MAG: ABC transporter substrate-binding protein [Thermotogota bacterium]